MTTEQLNGLAEDVRNQGYNPSASMKDLVYDPVSGEFKQIRKGATTDEGEVVTEMTRKGFAAVEPHLFACLREDEIRLYRIMDVTLNRSLWERLFGLGTIHCCSADKSTPEFDIRWIPHSADVKETLSNMIEEERQAKRVSSREFMTDEGDGDDDMM